MAFAAKGGPGRERALPDDRLRIQPSPRSIIPGRTAWARSSGAWTLASKISRRRFSG